MLPQHQEFQNQQPLWGSDFHVVFQALPLALTSLICHMCNCKGGSKLQQWKSNTEPTWRACAAGQQIVKEFSILQSKKLSWSGSNDSGSLTGTKEKKIKSPKYKGWVRLEIYLEH